MSGPGGDVDPSSYLDLALGRLLDAFADTRPAPGGGSAAAVAVALAAGVATMAARLSTGHSPDAAGMAVELDVVRQRVANMIDEDARVYGRVLAARRLGDTGPKVGDEMAAAPRRTAEMAAALSDAAAVPAAVVVAGARVAQLAAEIALVGKPEVRGDAIVAAQLAAAGAAGAAALVGINVAGDPHDDRPSRATALAHQASVAAEGALRAGTDPDPDGTDPRGDAPPGGITTNR